MAVREPMVLTEAEPRPEGLSIVATNPAFGRRFGWSEDELAGQPLSILSPAEEDVLPIGLAELDSPPAPPVPVALRTASGRAALVECEATPVRGGDGTLLGWTWIVREPTVHVDPGATPTNGTLELSGRDHLENRLDRSVERVARTRGYAFALVGVELAGLESVAALHGRALASVWFNAAVRRIREQVRPGDLVARLGPWSVAVLLDPFDPWGSPEEVRERLEHEAGDPWTSGAQRVRIGPIGAAGSVWSRHRPAADAREAIEEVERALAPEPDASAGDPGGSAPSGGPGNSRSRVEREDGPLSQLSRAIRERELHLAYLPLLSLGSGAPVGMEALLRWSHPTRGTLTSSAFMHDVERTGLVAHVGRWVLWRVCHQLKAWESLLSPGPALPVHVNLSQAEFWQRDLVTTLVHQTDEVGVNRSRLRLEVPESAVARDVMGAARVLGDLQSAGFDPWLDRFGEGGVPLRELPMLPIHQVKMSPLFRWVDPRSESDDLPSPLRQALELAKSLGWRVTATGIETARQRDLLHQAGCAIGQGFLLVEPIDSAAAAAFAKSRA